MGATAHLDLFNRSVAAFDALSDEEADAYLDGEGSEAGAPEAVQLLERLDGEFEPLLETEDIVALNAAWLRSQPDLLVWTGTNSTGTSTNGCPRIPNLAERQAEAAEEERLTAPEFEQIIRELCEVAGHTLLKITMGDPNHDRNGERVWPGTSPRTRASSSCWRTTTRLTWSTRRPGRSWPPSSLWTRTATTSQSPAPSSRRQRK